MSTTNSSELASWRIAQLSGAPSNEVSANTQATPSSTIAAPFGNFCTSASTSLPKWSATKARSLMPNSLLCRSAASENSVEVSVIAGDATELWATTVAPK